MSRSSPGTFRLETHTEPTQALAEDIMDRLRARWPDHDFQWTWEKTGDREMQVMLWPGGS